MKKYTIGVDIGGSHISCALVDMQKRMLLPESLSMVKVDNQASADSILHNWIYALKKSMIEISKEELAGIGFAMPGPFNYEKGIALFERVEKYYSLFNVNVAQSIRKGLKLDSSIPVRFMNDATAFAVGEAWIGKAANFEKSISITLGTGFGSAFVESGLPVLERDDVPSLGCLWHIRYKSGIADDYFSTRWFIKSYTKQTGKILEGVKEIAKEAESDNGAAEKLFSEFGKNLGQFLGPWIKSFKAGVLVIGGNMAGAFDLFGPSFKDELKNQKLETTVSLSELKEDAAIIGAARLLDEEFWIKINPLLSKM